MIRWFRRKRPAPQPQPIQITPEDRLVASWWGYTPQEWISLPEPVKVQKRDHSVYAPRFPTNSR